MKYIQYAVRTKREGLMEFLDALYVKEENNIGATYIRHLGSDMKTFGGKRFYNNMKNHPGDSLFGDPYVEIDSEGCYPDQFFPDSYRWFAVWIPLELVCEKFIAVDNFLKKFNFKEVTIDEF